MKCVFIIGCLVLSLLVGCRKEDWKDVTFTPPPNVNFEEIQLAIRELDSQTPPIVEHEGSQIHVRYNSMHIALQNIYHACAELQLKESKEIVK